jgi:hypothetical protein
MSRMMLVAALFAAACTNTTGGALIPDMQFTAAGTAPGAFTSLTGWNITLSQALIALGPFYFNVDPPSSDEFRSGVVIIQATEQTIVNVLDASQQPVTGGANGEAGTAVSVEIGLLTPDESTQNSDPADSATIGSGFGYVAGTAVMGSTSVPFQGPIAVDQGLVTDTEPLADLERIRGAAVQLTFTGTPATLQLVVDPTHWFDQCDFSEIALGPPPVGAGYTWATDGSTFADQLLQGVKGEQGVYNFSLSSE